MCENDQKLEPEP